MCLIYKGMAKSEFGHGGYREGVEFLPLTKTLRMVNFQNQSGLDEERKEKGREEEAGRWHCGL